MFAMEYLYYKQIVMIARVLFTIRNSRSIERREEEERLRSNIYSILRIMKIELPSRSFFQRDMGTID